MNKNISQSQLQTYIDVTVSTFIKKGDISLKKINNIIRHFFIFFKPYVHDPYCFFFYLLEERVLLYNILSIKIFVFIYLLKMSDIFICWKSQYTLHVAGSDSHLRES